MRRIKVGDLVICKLWLEPKPAVVVSFITDHLVTIIEPNGCTRNQFLWDLEVINASR